MKKLNLFIKKFYVDLEKNTKKKKQNDNDKRNERQRQKAEQQRQQEEQAIKLLQEMYGKLNMEKKVDCQITI